jgi:serine-protein kinase ATM
MRLTPSDIIVQTLFEPACRHLHELSITKGDIAGKVLFQYAMFCTAQLEDQHAIADIKRMENLYRTKGDEVARYNEPIRLAKENSDRPKVKRLQRDQDQASKLQKMDKDELQRLHSSQRTFLGKALENFLKCFSACSQFDQHLPKFCAIWLKHSKHVHDIVAGNLPSVPSYKFLPLLHQLCSRLSNEGLDDFQSDLQRLLLRTLNDHPFHSMHQIFSAKSSTGDAAAWNRAAAATELARIMSASRRIGGTSVREVGDNLSDLFLVYSDLANLPVDKKEHHNNEIPMSSYPALRRFRSKVLSELRLPPPGLSLPVSIDLDYSAIPYVHKYHHSFKLAGGLNQPKILDSVLSNGTGFRELVS